MTVIHQYAADGRLRHALLPGALIAAASVLVYLNALGNGFALDDVAIIPDNPRVHDLSDWRAIWLTPYWPFFGIELGLWRPLAIFLYALQWHLGGGEPLLFHAVNVVLHASVAVLGFLLLRNLTATGPALAGALVFAVHPVHTEAVANVVGQAELITAGALIAACWVHACRPPGLAIPWRHRLALVVLFAVAILTKEHAVVLPALLVATDLAKRRLEFTVSALYQYGRAMLVPMLLLGGVLALYLTFRFAVLEGSLLGVQAGPQLHFLREEYRVLNALRAFPEILRLLVFPYRLAIDYSPAMILPVESWTALTAVGALLVLAIATLALLTPRFPAAGFPAAWFFITIITVSNLFFPIGVLIAERTLYLPSFAVSAAIAFAWLELAPRAARRERVAAVALLVVVLLAGAVRTWMRTPDWRSTHTVLYSLVRDHPESYKAQWTHATWQWQLGRVDAARDHYELALRLYARDSQLMTDFANFLLMYGEPDRAVSLLEHAHVLHPFVPRTTVLLGQAYIFTGRPEEALRVARSAEQQRMSISITLPLRAAAYDALGREQEALAAWRHLVYHVGALEPPLRWGQIARALARGGAIDDARFAIQRGLTQAAADTASTRILTEVERAMDAGCYALPAAAGPADGAPEECDPLLPYDVPPPAQNATVLHNASRPAISRDSAAAGESGERQ
jgi:protein O-mannosyl-transferase